MLKESCVKIIVMVFVFVIVIVIVIVMVFVVVAVIPSATVWLLLRLLLRGLSMLCCADTMRMLRVPS